MLHAILGRAAMHVINFAFVVEIIIMRIAVAWTRVLAADSATLR